MPHRDGESVTAVACANIALCKYWGKAGPGNAPATPSISLALDALTTTTSVTRTKRRDSFVLNGRPAARADQQRIKAYLDLGRGTGLLDGHFHIESENNFPTAAGLASSASAYAALAKALSAFAGRRISISDLSRYARRGSGSSARSIPGGLAALPTGADPAARLLVKAEDVPWGMVVAVVDAPPKETGSREGMELSRRTSPYYGAWLKQAAMDYRAMLKSLRSWDLDRTGGIMEENMLAMHASMQATRPALLYWSGATIEVIRRVRNLRAGGVPAYATIDAGPHVAVLGRREDLKAIARHMKKTTGVLSAIVAKPGGPARII